MKSENISKINLKLLKIVIDEYWMELFCDIYRVIEKVLELYLVINWFGEKKVKLYIKIII